MHSNRQSVQALQEIANFETVPGDPRFCVRRSEVVKHVALALDIRVVNNDVFGEVERGAVALGWEPVSVRMIRDVPAAQVRAALRSKGFAPAEHGRRDHEMFFLLVDTKKTSFWVKLSRGASELRVGEIKMNAKAVGITGDALYRILCCEFDADRTRQVYEARL